MQYKSCGKASCVCHRNPQKKQGPYYYLSYKEGGKSQYKYLVTAMCSHIPERGEQMVRYYGYYSNVSRGKRIETEDDRAPPILVADKSPKE